MRDVAPVLRLAEVEGEQLDRFLEEDRVGDTVNAVGLPVVEERLVVAVLCLPLLDRRRGQHILNAELDARHVVGRIDDEEQHESQQVYADQHRDRVEDTAYQIGDHADRIVARSRRR